MIRSVKQVQSASLFSKHFTIPGTCGLINRRLFLKNVKSDWVEQLYLKQSAKN